MRIKIDPTPLLFSFSSCRFVFPPIGQEYLKGSTHRISNKPSFLFFSFFLFFSLCTCGGFFRPFSLNGNEGGKMGKKNKKV